MSSTSSYWCYRCTRFIQISPSTTCPHCSSGFVESLSVSSPRRHRHRSPFNPVVLLPSSSPTTPTFHLYYDDTSSPSSRLRPVPAPMSDFLMTSSGFDRLLTHLSSPPDPPPASKSSVQSLPTVLIPPSHDDLSCAICTDSLDPGSEARELPCRHLYHADCILPWLSIRNTCPVCRHALPEEPADVPDAVGLTIWRLPGGGFAVGRWRGGGEREREIPAVYTEMDGGGFGEPRRVAWGGSRRGRERGRGGFFRNFVSFFGRFRSGSSMERSRSRSMFGSLTRRRSRGLVVEEGSGMSRW